MLPAPMMPTRRGRAVSGEPSGASVTTPGPRLERRALECLGHVPADAPRCPAASVGQDAQDVRVVIRGVRLVARLEIQHPTQAAVPGAHAPEHLAAREPADHQQLIRVGDVEPFAVHLLLGQLDVVGDACHHGVVGSQVPESLVLARLAPLETAGRAHQPSEGLGEVTRVEHDEAHATQHCVLDPVDDLVAHLVVAHVTPPEQHVGRRQHLGRQAVFRLLEGRGPDVERPERRDAGGDGTVDALRDRWSPQARQSARGRTRSRW